MYLFLFKWHANVFIKTWFFILIKLSVFRRLNLLDKTAKVKKSEAEFGTFHAESVNAIL